MLGDFKAREECLPSIRQPNHMSIARSRPPAIATLLPAHFIGDSTTVCTGTPTRAGTISEDIELGVYLRPDSGSGKLGNPSTPPSNVFSRRGSNGSVSLKVAEEPKDFFLSSSTWQTDIITFCSHVRLNQALENARITQIQARKSRRLPFLHEYLLVYFTTGSSQHFVVRIDRLGKVGSSSTGGRERSRGEASNIAIQEIGIYRIQDSQNGVDSNNAPWLARDGARGSKPVATLVTCHRRTHTSHHLQTAAENSLRYPKLGDVSRLLEGVLLEMPAYNLTTANCYLMTRSSLLLLQRCYPCSFQCYLGGASSEAVTPSFLAEPVWTGLIQWYLPFAILLLLVYVSLFLTIGYLVSDKLGPLWSSRVTGGIRLAYLYGFAVPIPLGLIHAYMNSLEASVNNLVVSLSARFLTTCGGPDHRALVQTPPFALFLDSSLLIIAIWWMLGCIVGLVIFIMATVDYGGFAVFIVMLVLCVWFNLKFGDSGIGIGLSEEEEALFD